MIRILKNGESKVSDYKIFPASVIAKSDDPYKYEYNLSQTITRLFFNYKADGENKTAVLDNLLEMSDTTSFIVLNDDKIVYEKYFNGADKDSVETSFSSVKSLDSLMIGMAIEDGAIQNENQPITDYIPEFKESDFEDITICQLLMMRSKIKLLLSMKAE